MRPGDLFEQGLVFLTAMEAEYPSLLCTRMAACVRQAAEQLPVVPSVQPRLKELPKLGFAQQT